MSARGHLSEQDLEQYLRRALSPDELLASDDHLAQCGFCSGRLQERDEARGALVSATTAFQEALAKPEHLRYEQLAAYVDGELNPADRQRIEAHLQACSQCETEAQDLHALRAELRPGVAPAADSTPGARKAKALALDGPWSRILALWQGSAFGMPWRVAALAAAVALAAWLVFLPLRKPSEDRAARPALPATAPRQAPATEQVLVALNDGGGQVTLDVQGRLHGLASRDSSHEEAVQAALSAQRVASPPALRDLGGAAGTLMGVPDREAFRVLSPVATVVLEDRPIFRWLAESGASAYEVTVYTSDFRAVAAGRALTTTEWRPPRPLPRGQVYTWQVRALVGEKEVVVPPPAAPEAKFKVLEQSKADEFTRLRQAYGGSHLMLGVLYAQAGLLEEAQRELRALSDANPQSPPAQKLLDSVKALRR